MPDQDPPTSAPEPPEPPAAPVRAETPETVPVDRWQGEPVETWRRRWSLPGLYILRRVGSTNDVARRLAEDGAAAGTVVLADEQTRGRGQLGRAWRSDPGASLSFSMVLRPASTLEGRVLTLRLGIAAARAIESQFGIPIAVKWPNDILVGDRKVAGILCEGASAGSRLVHVVAGIGVNLRTPAGGWPAELEDRAGSLEEALTERNRAGSPGAGFGREGTGRGGTGSEGSGSEGAGSEGADAGDIVVEAAGAIAVAWRRAGVEANVTPGRLAPEERAWLEDRDWLRGRPVTVDGREAGVAAGVTATGALRVRSPDGELEDITAGTVRPATGRTP